MNVYIALNLRRTFQHQCSRQDSKSWWGKSKLASCPYSTDLVLHQYRLEFTTFHAQNRAKYRQWHVSVYRLCMLFATTAHLPAGSFPSKIYDDTILSHSSFALSCSTSTKSNLGQQKIVNWIILYMQGHLHVCTCNIYVNPIGYTEQGPSKGFAKLNHALRTSPAEQRTPERCVHADWFLGIVTSFRIRCCQQCASGV